MEISLDYFEKNNSLKIYKNMKNSKAHYIQ